MVTYNSCAIYYKLWLLLVKYQFDFQNTFSCFFAHYIIHYILMYFNYVGGKSESEKYMRLNGVGELEEKKQHLVKCIRSSRIYTRNAKLVYIRKTNQCISSYWQTKGEKPYDYLHKHQKPFDKFLFFFQLFVYFIFFSNFILFLNFT